MAIFGSKNHETIFSQVRRAHLACFGVIDSPPAPQKTYFLEIPQNMLKFGFLGGLRGVLGLEPSKMIQYMIIYYFWRLGGRKMQFFKNFNI